MLLPANANDLNRGSVGTPTSRGGINQTTERRHGLAAKITLGILARDAAQTLPRLLESAAPYVDEILIGLGGPSSDGTEEIAKQWLAEWIPGEQPHPIKTQVFPIQWHDDFARARNEVLLKATGEWFIWLDADDELVGGENLRRYVEQASDKNLLLMPYHYDEDEHGNLACTLWRERVVRFPQFWRWEGAVHETLNLDPSVPLAIRQINDVIVRHQPGRNKAKGTRNLDILYRELERTEPEPPLRLLYYLGRENASRGNLREALLHWNRYISMTPYNDEAYQVAHMIGDALRAQKRYPEAAKAALKAIEIAPDWPDSYFLLAKIAYEQGKFAETIEWTKAGATKEPPQTSVIIDPRSYTYWPYYYLGLANFGLGQHEEAVANLSRAASVIPDEQIMGLIEQARRNMDQQKVLDAFMTLYEHLGRWDEWLKVRKLFETAPKLIEQHPAVREGWERTYLSTPHVEDPQIMVDFYRGNPGWQAMPDDFVLSEEWYHHPRLDFARKSITCDPPATVLDIGSSDGFISLPLAKDGHIIEGYDLDPRTIEIANRRAKEWNLPAKYHAGAIEDVKGKYDVALAFEIIEHLVDPGAFLDQVDERARKVVITTPFLAWESGYVNEWNKVELKGHLRIFDLTDMEMLLSGRGRIFDLYREPFGPRSSWIFASYRPRQDYAGNIVFLAPGTLEEWSPRKLQAEGLGGSETALIRLAEELFTAGGDDAASQLCTVYGRIDNPGYYNGVRYRSMDMFSPTMAPDVLVAWRYPEAADLPTRAGTLVLWMHDTDAGDRLTPARAGRFDKIVVLSEWHKGHFLKTYPFVDEKKVVVIGNGVEIERFASPVKGGPSSSSTQRREPHRVAYTSSPDRGLDAVLEHVWPKVIEQVPDAELHVYYGWQNIDTLAPNYPQIAEFRQKCANLLIDSINVVQHGRLPQDQLAAELQRASVWLYPSHNFDETYCISAVEAQLAGAIPVTTNRGALAETVGSGIIIEGTIGQDDVAERYADALVQVLTGKPKELSGLRRKIRAAAPAIGWTEVASRWISEVLTEPQQV